MFGEREKILPENEGECISKQSNATIVKILENPVYAQLGAELTDDCGNYKDSI